MSRSTRLALALLAGAGALALSGGVFSQTRQPPAPQPTKISWLSPAGDPERGRELAATCLACHSAAAPAMEPAAPRLHRQRQSYLFFALAAYRDGGRESAIMQPLVEGMSDQDLRDIAAWVSGEMPDRPPPAATDHPAYARTVRDCTWCHGETGIGELEGTPVLTGQDAAYLVAALEEYRSGARSDPAMRAIASALTPSEMHELADYYAQYGWLEPLE